MYPAVWAPSKQRRYVQVCVRCLVLWPALMQTMLMLAKVGVEHLLRDINDPSTSTLAAQVKHKMAALGGLKYKLLEVQVLGPPFA
jgi:hypothetical protein